MVITGIGILSAGASLGGSSTASAADRPAGGEILATIESSAPETVDAAAIVHETAANVAVYEVDALTVSVPRDAAGQAVLSMPGREMRVSLPFAETAADAVTLMDGVSAYDNGNSSTTAPIVRDDGSLQIITVIENAEAPTKYDYDFSIPDGGSMTVRDDGVVIITDANDEFAGVVAPAWANDSDGEPVPTRYEVSGSRLTQIVEHGSGAAYPVTADPWAGITLFQSFKRDSYNGDYRYSAWVTPLGSVVLGGGGGVGGYLAGQAVYRGAGWNEWKAKWPAVTNKATIQQQYNCHVAASNYGLPFTRDYNLERYRANRSDWVSGVARHHCNW
jgi:hypothetical protein